MIFYIGLTSDLFIRIEKHKAGFYINSFTKKYNVSKLVWHESFRNINDAIMIEKKIKKWKKDYKIDMIIRSNPSWDELRDPETSSG